MYRYIGKNAPVIYALTFSLSVFLSGIYLAWQDAPVWLNRAGALIIIAGVLLGASRFYEWVQQKVAVFVRENYDSISNDALAAVEAERGSISEQERVRLRTAIKRELEKDLGEIIAEDKKHLKKWELYLIVCGTFLNGFGDYLVSLIKSYGT
jgi:hypothetical protein